MNDANLPAGNLSAGGDEIPPTAASAVGSEVDREVELDLEIEIDEPYAELVDVELLRRVVDTVLRHEQVTGAVEITLVVTDDEEVRNLNSTYRGIDRTTDVLSFPLEAAPGEDDGPAFVLPPGEPRHLGDIVISFPRASEQATDYGHSLRRELAFLAVHGTLHLLGHDHEIDSARQLMRQKEDGALKEVPRE